METRRVTFVDQKTQAQKVIENSTATTLGELKREMDAAGINYSGMTFYEGHMRAELKDDAAPLPTNIPYKGTVVNDLIFMLTTPEKKVKSGAMSRAEAYDEIRRLGLQDECKKKFGKNFTQCTTNDLVALVQSASKKTSKSAPVVETPVVAEPVVEEPVVESATITEETNAAPTHCNCGCDDVKRALQALADALYHNDVIEQETYNGITSLINGKEYKAPKKLSKNEIDEMFGFVRN